MAAPRAAREPTANPNVHVYHTTAALTEAVVDRAPAGVREVAGVANASANRYRMRVFRDPAVAWEALLPAVDGAVRRALGVAAIEPCPPPDDHRRFEVPGPPRPKAVFEGVLAAARDPLAAALFAIDGVAEVVLEGAGVTVRKGRLFGWERLEPGIRRLCGPR